MRDKNSTYMEAGMELKSAIQDYIEAAYAIGKGRQDIANDVNDALFEMSNGKISFAHTTIEE